MASISPQKMAAALLLLFCASAVLSHRAASLTCPQILPPIASCLGFASGIGSAPLPECCAGIHKLNMENALTPDKQQACNCIQGIIKDLPDVKPDRVAALPLTCGVNMGYPVTMLTDCSKVLGVEP